MIPPMSYARLQRASESADIPMPGLPCHQFHAWFGTSFDEFQAEDPNGWDIFTKSVLSKY